MATVHDTPAEQSRLERVLTTDFCPWANRFVYWLKEPIGWFVIAIAASAIVGMYANPIGWTFAAALFAIVVVGMIWPLVVVWAANCELGPETDVVHEDTSCKMIFSVRNRLPLPLWGLAVEGYLDNKDDESLPVVALSHVPPICVADYAISVCPTMRGHYPVQTPSIACSFPFGIWTAKRELKSVKSLTVWPRVYELAGRCPLTGQVKSEQGDGNRSGHSGDFVGVRDFRRGDSPKHINWAQSARTETFIVTERSGPQVPNIDLLVDPSLSPGRSRESLSNRLRVAASIICNLYGTNIPTNVSAGDLPIKYSPGHVARRKVLDALADIPIDGINGAETNHVDSKNVTIQVLGEDDSDNVVVVIADPNAPSRTSGKVRRLTIDCTQPLNEQLIRIWQEIGHVSIAA